MEFRFTNIRTADLNFGLDKGLTLEFKNAYGAKMTRAINIPVDMPFEAVMENLENYVKEFREWEKARKTAISQKAWE